MKLIKKALKKNLSNKLLSIFRIVLADEGGEAGAPPSTLPADPVTTPSTPASITSPTISYETLIAQARKEEKEKLYPQITKLKEEKEAIVTKLNASLLQVGEKENKIQELLKEIEKLQKGKTDPEEVKVLKEKVASLESENAQIKSEVEKAKLDKFKEAEISKLKGEVIPELIIGGTEEEILASIQVANTRYKEIFEKAKGATTSSITPTAPPVTNPSISGLAFDFKNVTPEMIRNMNSQDYAKYRAQMGLK